MNICMYGEEYALADYEVSKERSLKMAELENEFKICAHEHAIVRKRILVGQSSVVLLAISGYLHWVK